MRVNYRKLIIRTYKITTYRRVTKDEVYCVSIYKDKVKQPV